MNPIFTPAIVRIAVAGKNGTDCCPDCATTFAERYWNPAPANPSPSWQPSEGWHPPICIRRSSSWPRSNSWLPTDATASFIALSDSIAGSSWKSAETSGDAPIRSPAATMMEFGFRARWFSRCVARYSAPPAGVPPTTPFAPAGGSRFPWKSLRARS